MPAHQEYRHQPKVIHRRSICLRRYPGDLIEFVLLEKRRRRWTWLCFQSFAERKPMRDCENAFGALPACSRRAMAQPSRRPESGSPKPRR